MRFVRLILVVCQALRLVWTREDDQTIPLKSFLETEPNSTVDVSKCVSWAFSKRMKIATSASYDRKFKVAESHEHDFFKTLPKGLGCVLS